MKVYLLKHDFDHLVDMQYDIALLPFKDDATFKNQLLSQDEITVKQPIEFLANFAVVKGQTNYLIVDQNIEVMSSKMIELLSRVRPFKFNRIAATLIDERRESLHLYTTAP